MNLSIEAPEVLGLTRLTELLDELEDSFEAGQLTVEQRAKFDTMKGILEFADESVDEVTEFLGEALSDAGEELSDLFFRDIEQKALIEAYKEEVAALNEKLNPPESEQPAIEEEQASRGDES